MIQEGYLVSVIIIAIGASNQKCPYLPSLVSSGITDPLILSNYVVETQKGYEND